MAAGITAGAPARFARLIGNPATRAAVPTRFLPPALQRLRAQNAARAQAGNSPLYNPLAILSGGALKQAVTDEVNSALNPAEDLLRGEQSAQSRRIGDYYNQMLPQFQRAAQASSDAASQLAQHLAASGKSASDAITGDQAQAQAAMAHDQAVRGGGLDAGYGNALNALFASQKGTAQALNNVAQQQAAGHSQGHETVAQTAAAVLPARALDAQSQLANRIAGQIGVIEQKRPGLIADTLNKLRQQGFTDYATAQGLNLKGDALTSENQFRQGQLANARQRNQNSLTLGRQRNSIAQQNANTSASRLAETTRHDQAMEALRQQAAKKGVNGLTPAQQRTLHAANAKWRADAAGASNQAATLLKKVGQPVTDAKGNPIGNKKWTLQDVKSYLSSKIHDGDMVDVAFALAQGKGLPAQIVQRLKARHIGVPQRWLPPTPPPNPNAAIGAPPLGPLPPGQ